MFTGIIEEIGQVQQIKRGQKSFSLSIKAAKALEELKLGDSIAVNGVCLTVTGYSGASFEADVMPETYQGTTLKTLSSGSPVNLERALRLSDRLGGHLVQGHVDGIGTIINKTVEDIAILYHIEAPPGILKYVVAKGSIAVDGVSLTVVEVDKRSFSVSLIPHTAKLTILGWKREGERVNLETDIIGRYVEKLWLESGVKQEQKKKDIDINYLAENGFI
ncbi:MAG: riboflavin synthase [Syntrophomonadaceae bacterium]|nr:riboflavin synthase [Syntrophomonadaceae bacterium]